MMHVQVKEADNVLIDKVAAGRADNALNRIKGERKTAQQARS
jgi:hypothetical protein